MGKHLTQEQKEAARTMRVDGKSLMEIQAYLKKEHGVKITEQGLRYVCKGCANNKVGAVNLSAPKNKRRRGNKVALEGVGDVCSSDELVTEIKAIISQFGEDIEKLQASHKQTLLGIRAELLKSRQQFRDMNPSFDPDKE